MSADIFLNGRVQLCCGDSLHFLRDQPDDRYDSVVTDPPYSLASIVKRFGKDGAAPAKGNDAYMRASAGFMGKKWDTGETAFAVEFWQQIFRTLKPGGHVVAFGGTRTYHRLTCAIEDAGFEIRDQLQWIYGSGFPKSHDVSKGIDRAAGVKRKVIGERRAGVKPNGGLCKGGLDESDKMLPVTAPATNAAREWNGWGTALKPSCEPICLARKPLIGTVAANVIEHGTGAINIDGCRIDSGGTHRSADSVGQGSGRATANVNGNSYGNGLGGIVAAPHSLGRWPANIIHDGSDEVMAAFPETTSGNGDRRSAKDHGIYGAFAAGESPREFDGDSGSAARFFASFPFSKSESRFLYSSKADSDDRLGSKHPTVKPVDLMQWLVRLVTPKGGLVLDPFAGTGTTAEACYREGMRCVLVERETEYQADIRRRMALVLGGPEERRRESIKARNFPVDHGPLFAEAAE